MLRKKKKTVLHLISSLEIGGIEKLLADYVEYAHRAERKYECMVAVINDKYDPYLISRLKKHCDLVYLFHRKEGQKNPIFLLKLIRLIYKHRVALIHTHDHGSKYFSILCKAFKPAVRLVFSVHDTFLFQTLSAVKLLLHRKLVDRNIAISQSVGAYCEAKGMRNTKVIYNGVVLSRYKQSGRTFMQDGILKIVNVSRISHRVKGQDILLKALHLLRNEGIEFTCTFIGGVYDYDRESYPYLLSLVDELKLGDRVSFLGSRNDVPELLARHDVFVLPSRTEGFGLVLVEAAASGLAVIASDIEGPAELIEGGLNGVLFEAENEKDLFEKIRSLVHGGHADADKTYNAANLNKFDISVMCDQYDSLYEVLIGS